MYLTKEEEKMLNGEYGPAVEKSMRLLVKLGEIYGAEKMIEISSAQIAGISYKNIGDPGVEFLEGFLEEGAKVRVLAFMNPAGMDLESWKELGIPEEFAEKQMRIINALKRMGVYAAATCTPYLAGLLPRYGEHIAWSESSAVIFANSVIGARTNREGGPSALAAAITGRTPMHGFHLNENRTPEVTIVVESQIKTSYEFGILAHAICKKFKKGVPYITGINPVHANIERLKLFGATLAAYGAFSLFHMEGVTPENVEAPKEKIHIEPSDLNESKEEMGEKLDSVDLVVIGCPHASLDEIKRILKVLNGRKMKVPMLVFTSRSVRVVAKRTNLISELEKLNIKVLADTCPVVMPLEYLNVKRVATDSGKAIYYLPNTNNVKVLFDSLERLVERFGE